MTSMQWSESANHMLKIYMPPASPLHMFVGQYMRLQFDMEREESYEEERTMIGGVTSPVMRRTNLEIERHASKLYTRAIFEQFGERLFEGH